MRELSPNAFPERFFISPFRGSPRFGRMAHMKKNENMMKKKTCRRVAWMTAIFALVVNALGATPLAEVPAVTLGSGLTLPAEPLGGPLAWESRLSAGLVYKSGNTDSERMTLGLATEKFTGQTLLRAYANGSYETMAVEDEDGQRAIVRTVGDAKAGANLKRRIAGYFVFADAWVFHDDMADVRYRAVESGGLGVFLVETARVRLTTETGLAYVLERAPERDAYLGLRVAERFDWQATEVFKLWEAFEAVPRFEDFENMLAMFEVGGESAISRILSLAVKLKMEYDSDPSEDVEALDATFITELTYLF